MSYKIILDTETNGIPKKTDHKSNYDYKNLEDFREARLLSISYIVIDANNDIKEKKTIYVNPQFELLKGAQKIHGLTKEFLNERGCDIEYIINDLTNLFSKYNINEIIAHNIEFDINIILSEIYRHNEYSDLLSILLYNVDYYCTMKKFFEKINYYKWPKLGEAYKYFYNEEIINAHDSEYDTLHCYKVYVKLIEL